MLNLSPQRINSHFARVGRVALLRITCGERLQYQVSAVIRIPTPFAAKGGDDRESICHVPDTFSYPLPARKMIFCNTDEECGWRNCQAVKRRPQNFSTPINRHPSIPTFAGGASQMPQRSKEGQHNLVPITHEGTFCRSPQAWRALSLGGGGKNKIIWQSVLFAPPERLDGVYGPAAAPRKRFRLSHCSRKGIRVYLLHFSKH